MLVLLLSHANAATPRYDFSFEEPLVIAADRGNIHEITRLLKTGAKVNKQDKFGVTSLMRAVFRGNSEVVKILLDAGADVHIKDMGGATALHMASRLGHKTISDMLLKNGANPNALDAQGYTPLERAIKNEREGVVRVLISEGADLTQKGHGGLTPSELAFQGNNKKIQQIFNEVKPIVMIELPKVADTMRKNDENEQISEGTNTLGALATKEKASANETVIINTTKTNNLLLEQKLEPKEKEAEPAPGNDIIENKESNQSGEEVNILGVLTIKEKASANTAEKETVIINTDKTNSSTLASEEKIVPHEEPIAPKIEEDSYNNAALIHSVSKNEQSFDILAWFKNLESPLADTQHDNIEKEVTFTIAEDDQLIGPELAANSEPEIVLEEDIIITQSILAPEIVHTSKPKQENATTVADNNVTTTIGDLKESITTKGPKNKELLVQAREAPDDFQLSHAQNNMTTTPASYHIELGSFHSEIEAKNFINAKLAQHTTQAEVIPVASNLYKVTMKDLNEARANSLCSTLAPSNSAMNCSVLNQLSMVSDASFGLY